MTSNNPNQPATKSNKEEKKYRSQPQTKFSPFALFCLVFFFIYAYGLSLI